MSELQTKTHMDLVGEWERLPLVTLNDADFYPKKDVDRVVGMVFENSKTLILMYDELSALCDIRVTEVRRRIAKLEDKIEEMEYSNET